MKMLFCCECVGQKVARREVRCSAEKLLLLDVERPFQPVQR
jgi:hypothetical protein